MIHFETFQTSICWFASNMNLKDDNDAYMTYLLTYVLADIYLFPLALASLEFEIQGLQVFKQLKQVTQKYVGSKAPTKPLICASYVPISMRLRPVARSLELGTSTSVSILGAHQGRPGAVNLCPFVSVDVNL